MSSDANGFATKEQLLATARKRRYATATLPVSQLKVRVQSLTEKEYSDYTAWAASSRDSNTGIVNQKRLAQANARLLALCLVDGNGERLFGPSEFCMLDDLDAGDTQYLYEVCAEHCGIRLNDIAKLVKNSAATTDGA